MTSFFSHLKLFTIILGMWGRGTKENDGEGEFKCDILDVLQEVL
jgi:hypothetical protein